MDTLYMDGRRSVGANVEARRVGGRERDRDREGERQREIGGERRGERERAWTLAALDVAPVNLIYRHDASPRLASSRLARVATPSSRSVSPPLSLSPYLSLPLVALVTRIQISRGKRTPALNHLPFDVVYRRIRFISYRWPSSLDFCAPSWIYSRSSRIDIARRSYRRQE